MNFVILGDMRQLVVDARKVQRELDMLAQDHKTWTKEREQNGLANLIDHLKKLEFDLSIIQADCVSIGHIHQKDSAWQASLHRCFVILNNLFNDLKKMKREMNKAYIYSSDVKELEIDWGRFSKTVWQIESHLRN